MPASPDQIRGALAVVTTAAATEVRAVAQQAAPAPEDIRNALFATTPLIVTEYGNAAATLAGDWFLDLRDEAGVPGFFDPEPVVSATTADIDAMVARTTEALYDFQRDADRIAAEIEAEVQEALAQLEAEIAREVAAGFRDTMTNAADEDPEAAGWRRFAQASGCKMCQMLAARGAIYTETSVRFAAHTNCSCVVGPSWDQDAPRADVMQYMASKRRRTPTERAALRKYLNENYADAPG